MKHPSLPYFIRLFLLFAFYCSPGKAQITNPCGVKAVILPATTDSVVPVNTIVSFQSTSTNATSLKWLYDGLPSGASGPLWNYQIKTGVHTISLVAYNGNCTDTSTVVYFSAGTAYNVDSLLVANYGTYLYNEEGTCIDKTRDGGFILGGVQYLWGSCGEAGIVVKLRDKGCIDWSKKFLSPYNCNNSKITAIHASMDTSYYVATNNLELARLDKNGNIVWNKRYWIPNEGWKSVQNIFGDPQGAVYMVSPAFNNGLMITKIDKNGSIVWNKLLRLSGNWSTGPGQTEYSIPGGVVWLKGKLYISGNAYSKVSSTHFRFITKLDATTGAREWQYGYTDPEFPGSNGFTHLALYDTLLMASTGSQGHVVSLIDQQGSVIKNIKTKFGSSYGPKVSKAGADSKGHIYMMQWTEEPLPLQPYYFYSTNFSEIDTSLNKYGGIVYAQYSRGFFADATIGLDNKFAAVGQDFGYVDDGLYGSRDFRFIRLDTVNREQFCFTSGNDYEIAEKILHRLNFQYEIDSFLTITPQDATPFTTADAYIQSRYTCPDFIDSCSFMKISGPVNLCSFANTYTYRMHRNKKCILAPQWQLPAGVTITHQTDSTLTLKFPGFGVYRISATLNSCTPVKDSLIVSIVSKTRNLYLGKDTTICNNSLITLRAGPGFLTYLWKDGSTDSFLNATEAGIYWVEAADSCGNILRDSITLSPFSFAIDIGPDRIKCNNDTLHLNAPPGFLSYKWSNNYNISSTQSQNVIINPLIDTAYYLKVEKLPGCFAFDTVRIDVRTSPVIQLGQDKSFCEGDSTLINVGTGFAQYQWNNGSFSQQIFVHTAGDYSVIATTAEGCKSYDTLHIANVWPNPIVNLDHNTDLCTGASRVLEAGNFSSYSWQDGSTLSSFTVTNTGTYYVTVTNSHQCKATDTVHVVRLLPLPANFLPSDTAICNYGTLLIKPSGSYNKYTWSNNATSSSISITMPGIYWLQVTDASDCIGKDSIIVNSKECLNGFYIPNAFTPDGNGINDLFKPTIGGVVKQYQFNIYDRGGQVMFSTKDLNTGWNGMYKGTAPQTNVFAWMCTYQLEGAPVKVEKGTVVIIR